MSQSPSLDISKLLDMSKSDLYDQIKSIRIFSKPGITRNKIEKQISKQNTLHSSFQQVAITFKDSVYKYRESMVELLQKQLDDLKKFVLENNQIFVIPKEYTQSVKKLEKTINSELSLISEMIDSYEDLYNKYEKYKQFNVVEEYIQNIQKTLDILGDTLLQLSFLHSECMHYGDL